MSTPIPITNLSRRDLAAELAKEISLLDLITIPLAVAMKFSGLTRDEIKRKAPYIDHGNRNQVITLSAYLELLKNHTVDPESE